MNDLLCVGAVDNILLSSTIGRNKPDPGKKSLLPLSMEQKGTEIPTGVSIYSTGGETADVSDLVRTIIVIQQLLAG